VYGYRNDGDGGGTYLAMGSTCTNGPWNSDYGWHEMAGQITYLFTADNVANGAYFQVVYDKDYISDICTNYYQVLDIIYLGRP